GMVSSLTLAAKEYTGLGFDSSGRLLIANYTDGTILRESSAGSGSFGNFATGLNKPRDVAGTSDGGAVVTNSGLSRIVRLDPAGVKTDVTTAGQGFSGDGGPATGGAINISPANLVIGQGKTNQLPETVNIVVGPNGEAIFADTNNNRIRMVGVALVSCVKTGTITISGNNPTPVLTSLNPNTAVAGSGAFTLTANGSGFAPSSIVRWNG